MEKNTKNQVQIQLSRCFYLIDATNQACEKENRQYSYRRHKTFAENKKTFILNWLTKKKRAAWFIYSAYKG